MRNFRAPGSSGRGMFMVIPLVCLALSVAPAAAQNLLTNPDFDTDLSGWGASAATSHDASLGGSSGPGSAQWSTAVDVETVVEDLVIVSQCVDGVVAGTTYQFGGEVNLGAAPDGASAIVVVGWQDDPGCSGLIALEAAQPVTTTGAFMAGNGSAVAPTGAESAEIVVISGLAPVGPGPVEESDVTVVEGQYLVNVDDLFFEAQQPVPTIGAAWLLALVALLLALGLLAARRDRLGQLY